MLQNLSIEGKSIHIDSQTHFANVANLNQALVFGALDHYRAQGTTYVDVPEIVGITGACENVDTLFRVHSRLGIPLFFVQTGQLSLEQALQSFHAVCTIIHSGRDEEEEDERHLRQFRLTEEEFDATAINMGRTRYDEELMFEELLNHIQSSVQAMIKLAVDHHGNILNETYHRDIEKLKHAATHPFLRISYEDAIPLLQSNGFPELTFGEDLGSRHEAEIVQQLNTGGTELPVFIMRYPKDIKFFNMKVSERDPRVVLSTDCVFPYSGEGVGSAVREHDFERLNQRLLGSTMYRLHQERGGVYEDFEWYLSIMREEKTLPHAGYGIGNNRVMQYLFGERDIRNTSLFALLNRQTKDWEKK